MSLVVVKKKKKKIAHFEIKVCFLIDEILTPIGIGKSIK